MQRTNRVLLLIVLFAALIHSPASFASTTTPEGGAAQQVTSLPKGVSIHQLNNGMKVLLIENPALPAVGVNVVVQVGSAYETFSTSGMSHMLEHLLFNGTTTRTQKQLYDDVDRIGGYNNASTAEFYTNYMMVMPAENMKKGMEIQADMLFGSTLPLDKFEKEKGIVLEEISKSIASPQEQLERNALSILYPGHALSLPTLGTYSTIQSMSRDKVNNFFKNNYVPNNMILTAIGNFQTNAMLSLIKETYGQANPGQVIRESNPEWATGFQKPVSLEKEPGVYHRFYDGDDQVLQVYFPLPSDESSDYFHLFGLVIEKNREALQASLKTEFSQNVKSLRLSTRLSHLGNYLEAVVTLKAEVAYDSLVSSLSTKLAGLNFKLSPEMVKAEVTRARTEFVKNIEKPHMFGIYNSNALVKKGIETVLASFSGGDSYKAARDLATLKIGAAQFVLLQMPSAKKGKEKVETQNAMKFFKDEATGKNLVVVQNDASNLLAIHYLVKHKAVYESKYGKDASKILHDCLDQRLKSDANRKTSSQYGFTFTVNDNPMIPMDDIYLHPDFGYVRVEGLADDVLRAISYLNSQMKNFVPTEDEFKKSVEKFKGIAMMQMMAGDKSKKLFDDTYKSLVYEPDSYSTNQPALTYEGLVAFASVYFMPSNMVISVVSPSNPDSVNALFDQLGFAPVRDEPAVFTPTFLLPTKTTTVEKPGSGERSYAFWGFIIQIDPNDAPMLQALSLVLADDIVFDIREKQGMAYNMSAGVELIKDKALFFISQGTRPQNIDKLIPQYPKFFRMAALDSLTQEKLEKSINMYLGRMMFRRLSSINQAFYLGNSIYFFNDYNHDKLFLERLKNVKLADVKNTAKKYMHGTNPLLLIVR
ncbi:MAG: putative Zn-dependent peptidase [Bacteroidetes bacterium]|nr:putative Zn-dependent peptidase [Bacteroidota bacterium]